VGKALLLTSLAERSALSTPSPKVYAQPARTHGRVEHHVFGVRPSVFNIVHKAYYNGYPSCRKTSSNRRDPALRALVNAYGDEEYR
jgi:hypothetical protein